MTILGRLTTLTHLDDMMVAEEEAACAVQTAAGAKVTQVYEYYHSTMKDQSTVCGYLPVKTGFTVIQSDLLTLCLQASLLALSRTSGDRPRSLSLLSTAQLLCSLSPAPSGLNRELEPDWTAKVSMLFEWH